MNGESTSMAWPTLGSRTAKEQNRAINVCTNDTPPNVMLYVNFVIDFDGHADFGGLQLRSAVSGVNASATVEGTRKASRSSCRE